VGTVKTHLHSLYTVMGARSRAEAIVMSQGWML
jgi:DNA-binding CsgD family transcriptional regulator